MQGSVTFLTLFLSMLTGVHPVTVAVEGDIARVEFRLDGESLGFMDAEPWTMDCDFGEDLAPHELVAVGYDPEGREIARVKQLVNLPRAQAEARLSLEDREDGPPRAARLTWSTVENLSPRSVEVRFDDRPLSFDDPSRIQLPAYDPQQPHFLTAELTFGDALKARTLTSFGGEVGMVDTELTAVPILGEDKKAVPPPATSMASWFLESGTRLPVFAVEKTPADVLLVVDYQAWTELKELHGFPISTETLRVPRRLADRSSFPQRHRTPVDGLPTGLRRGDRFRFVATFPTLLPGERPKEDKLLFEIGSDLNTQRGGAAIASTLLLASPPPKPQLQSLAYAVAVAGRTAAAGERPRAVVLIVSEGPEDISGLSPANVQGYLEKLRVPLHVWRTSGDQDSTWGGASIKTTRELKAALKSLRLELDRQHVVWLEGSHLPQDIELRHPDWKIAG